MWGAVLPGEDRTITAHMLQGGYASDGVVVVTADGIPKIGWQSGRSFGKDIVSQLRGVGILRRRLFALGVKASAKCASDSLHG